MPVGTGHMGRSSFTTPNRSCERRRESIDGPRKSAGDGGSRLPLAVGRHYESERRGTDANPNKLIEIVIGTSCPAKPLFRELAKKWSFGAAATGVSIIKVRLSRFALLPRPPMIRSAKLPTPFPAEFTNGKRTSSPIPPLAKESGEAGFGPHELLEAALAICLTMTVQISAAKRGF